MTEKDVLKNLGFLIEKYKLKYSRNDFIIHEPMITETYSFYNDNGCFIISNLQQRQDVSYFVINDFKILEEFIYSSSEIKNKSYININKYWEGKNLLNKIKYVRYLFDYDKLIIENLPIVIEKELKENKTFFGIKI